MTLQESMQSINHQIDLIEQEGNWTKWEFTPLTQFMRSVKEIRNIARKHKEDST